MKGLGFAAVLAVSVSFGSVGGASTLQLDGYTAPAQMVHINSSPVPGTPSRGGATGFNITDTTGPMGSFVAWCLDVAHYLMSPGSSQDYNATNTPFSNSQSPSTTALDRVQAVFDANLGSVDVSNGDQAAAFQMALWEAAFEADANALSVSNGLFQASSNGSTGLANTYLSNAAGYAGPRLWNLTFLEVDGFGPNRGMGTGQNLVTASAVPLPAAGLLMLTGLFGFGAAARRRKAHRAA